MPFCSATTASIIEIIRIVMIWNIAYCVLEATERDDTLKILNIQVNKSEITVIVVNKISNPKLE